jgi:hypothetical protein
VTTKTRAMVHSFHLAELAPLTTARALARPPKPGSMPGLCHVECLAMMRLGSPSLSPERMQLRRLAVFAAWADDAALDCFLTDHQLGRELARGWHVRLEFLRGYGEVAALAPPSCASGRSRSTAHGRAVGCCRSPEAALLPGRDETCAGALGTDVAIPQGMDHAPQDPERV